MSDASWATPKALLDLWRAIAGCGPGPQAVLDTLAEKLAELLGDGIAIDLVEADGTLRRAAARGFSGDEAGGPVEEAVGTGRAQLIRTTSPDAPSMIVAPLPGNEGVLGAVTAMRRAGNYDQADLSALREIAGCAALAFTKARAQAGTAERLEAVASSEAWLRDLFDSSPAVIFVKDLEGRYVTVNKRCEQNMGRRREDLIGKNSFDMLPKDLAASFHRIDRQVIESGGVVETEDKFFLAGAWHVFLAIKFPLRDAAGRIRGTAGMSTEITNRIRAVEVLQQGREQLSFITDALPALVCYLDTEERYQFLNTAHEAWFGTPRSQFSGRPLRDFIDEQAYATMLPYIKRTLEGESCTFEATLSARGTAPRYARVTFSPHRNFSGRVEGFVALMTDVTEHKLSEGRNRLLADASKLLTSSFEHRATLRRVAELLVPGFADRVQIEIGALAGHSTPFVVEVPEPDGAAADPLRTFTAPLTIHDETVGRVTLVRSPARPPFEAPDLAVAEELARRIALAVENARLFGEAQRAIRLRDEFMSMASHELRTPLTALALDLEVLTRLLERQATEPRTIQRANKLKAHFGRLTQLVLTLLDVSQIEAGRLAIEPEALDLRLVIGEAIERFAEQAAQSHCELRAVVPPGPVQGEWDRLRIDQVLTNLLSNAIRYAPGRSIDVELATASARVTLIVRDHGPGIRPDDRERIFGRFERAVSDRGIGGFGLGLWITRQIVLALGGTIHVDSVPDVETAFVIELPWHEGSP